MNTIQYSVWSRLIVNGIKCSNKVKFLFRDELCQVLLFKSDIPQTVIDYVAKQVNVVSDVFISYDWAGRTARYHRAQIREFFGFREATVEDAEVLVERLANQELVLDTTLEALLATAYDRCRALRLEPPTPERMHRLTRSAIRLAEKRFRSS